MTVLITCALFLVCFSDISQAAMPSYERLQSITDNLKRPQKIALDSLENIYITEASTNKLLIYNPVGEYLTSLFGLSKPISVAVDIDGNIFVGNNGRGNVEVYNGNLEFQFKLNDPNGDGEFKKPAAIAIDNINDNVYVVDMKDHVVKVYDRTNGAYVSSFGSPGSENGEFNRPMAIAIDEIRGEIIILDRVIIPDWSGDYEGARLQVFNMSGNWQRSLGVTGWDEGQMKRPQGVAVDELSRIYVIDSLFQFVFIYDNNGNYLGKISDPADPVRTPIGIAIGTSKRMFVVSLSSGKFDIYRIDGTNSPDITSEDTSRDFGIVHVGETSSAQSFSIFNIGDANLDIGTAIITGTDASDFSVQSDNCSGQPVSALGSCTISIVAIAGSTGIKDAVLSIPSNDPDTDPFEISLASLANFRPVPNANGPYFVVEGQTVTLDVTGSSDTGGSIILYEWDIDNDGVIDYSFSAPATQDHVYAQDGLYTVKLRVTDDLGSMNETTTTVNVSDTAPVADFTASNTIGSAPLGVTFTNNSIGYDGPLTYEWDFDNDGSIDSNDISPSHTYTQSGLNTVSLKVTDADGSIDTMVKTDYINVSTVYYDLTVNFLGTGSGTVTSFPVGIDCIDDCVGQFEAGNITLTASAGPGSTFTGWSGDCGGMGVCQVILTANASVEANFENTGCGDPVEIKNKNRYTIFQNAIESAVDDDIVQTHDIVFIEDLVVNSSKRFTIDGGFDCDFSDNPGMTTINGNLIINDGTVTIGNIILE